MSMISAQCNELRDTADKLDKTSAVSTSWIHYKLTPMMRDAADTIWQLRDDLQRANGLLADAEHDESRAWDMVHKAKAENVKLREFASGMYGLLEMFDQLMGTDDNLGTPRPLLFGDGGSFRDVARELGVEVH